MEEDIVINFQNVGKRFKKGRKLLLKEAILDVFKPGSTVDYWALKDVSFKIKRGETIGIIGKNGSGKSTILKLISGVMFPTTGKVLTIGSIAPLIELGAGFHPELSGRENIYLNGTILGLKKKEIDNKIDEIIKFAELEEFIDTPIKHYSSGMYVRLGFAIAVHTNPEILLVDEILAVGDEEFQKKSYKQMQDFKARGITIVFVSHSLDLVEKFCTRVIYIETGKVKSNGDPSKVITEYKNSLKVSNDGV